MVRLGELGPCCLDCGRAPHPGEPCPQPAVPAAPDATARREVLLDYTRWLRDQELATRNGYVLIQRTPAQAVDAFLAARAAAAEVER